LVFGVVLSSVKMDKYAKVFEKIDDLHEYVDV